MNIPVDFSPNTRFSTNGFRYKAFFLKLWLHCTDMHVHGGHFDDTKRVDDPLPFT